jgi:membrane-associated phospholipid phosphatase
MTPVLGSPPELVGPAPRLPGAPGKRRIPGAETLRGAIVHALLGCVVFLALYHSADRGVAAWCRSLDAEVRRPFEIAGQIGNSLPYLVALPLLWMCFRLKRMRFHAQACWFGFAALCGAGVWVNLVKPVVGRLRPIWLHREGRFGFDPFTIDPMKMSFPSGHSAVAVALALALGFHYPRLRVPLCLVASLVCVSRVVSGSHYPSDVVLGAYFAFFIATSFRRELASAGVLHGIGPGDPR